MKTKSYDTKHRLMLIAVLSLIVGAFILFVSITNINRTGSDENAIAARVNGEAVSVRELKRWMTEQRPTVYDYFKREYDVDISGELWNESFNGEVPNEMAKSLAMRVLTRIKVQQILAKKNGIMEDISYEGFLKMLEEENKRRERAMREGEAVYGPERYGETEYFNYVFHNMQTELKKKLKVNIQQYEKMVDDMVINAEIEFISDVWDRISIQ